MGERLGPVPWAQIRTDWPERRFGALRQAVIARAGPAVIESVDRAVGGPGELDDAEATLRRALAARAGDGELRLLLAAYVYSRCLDEWERTDEYERIEMALGALGGAIAGTPGAGDAPELLGAVLALSRCMGDAMQCENALSCSCCVELGRRAEGVVGQATEVLASIDRLGDGAPELVELVRADATTQARYFQNVRRVAAAVEGFVTRDAPGPEQLDGLLQELLTAEQEEPLKGDVFASELRAHRAALQAINDNAGRDRLRVNEAELAYIFPFALVDPSSRRPLALEDIEDEVRDGARRWTLGASGVVPADVLDLDLTDLWQGTEEAPVTYRGLTIRLPGLAVRTTADDDLGEVAAEIRLTSFGNHHLRIRPPPLADAGLHELNQALRRGSESMGHEVLTIDGQPIAHGRLADYADEVIHGLAAHLATADGSPGAEAVREHDASFHVVLNAPFLSIQHALQAPTPADAQSLQGAFGISLLMRPIRQMATALEEWARYPPGSLEERNLIEGIGYEGDLLLMTTNTTVLHMPATPDWMVREYVEMVEFVASLPPLLMVWRRWAARESSDLADFLSGDGGPPESTEGRSERLDEREFEVLATESAIRARLADAASSELFHRRAYRDLLDRLYRAAGLRKMEDDLRQQLDVLARQRQRLSALIERHAESDRRERDEQRRDEQRRDAQRNERVERSLNFVLAIVAAASLAELFSWVNDAWGGDEVGRWIELGILALLVVVMVYLLRTWFTDVKGLLRKRRVRRLSATDGALLRRAYADVLAHSFERDELEDVETLVDGLAGAGPSELAAIAAIDDDDAPLGILIAERYPEAPGVLLLSYLAVRPDARGRGIGTLLMESALDGWRSDPGVLLVVGEAHDPRAWARTDAEDPASRLRLYERLGARALGVPFVQPALEDGRSRVPGFLLLDFYAAEGALASADAVRSDLVAAFIRAYYRASEGPPRPDDAELQGLLRWIDGRPAVRRLALDDYARVPTLASITGA